MQSILALPPGAAVAIAVVVVTRITNINGRSEAALAVFDCIAVHGIELHRFACWFQSRVCLRHSSFGSSSPPTKTSCTPLVRHCRSAAQFQPHCYVLWRCRPPTCLPACTHRLAQRATAAWQHCRPSNRRLPLCLHCRSGAGARALAPRARGRDAVTVGPHAQTAHVRPCGHLRTCLRRPRTHTHTSAHTQAHKRTATRTVEAAGTKTIRLLRHLQQCTA